MTITRLGKPVAALISVEAKEIARRRSTRKRAGLVSYLRDVPQAKFPRDLAGHRGPASTER